MSVLVIIPAAGSGVRFGGDVPKQYRLLAGRPILARVVERFAAIEDVDRVVVAVSGDRLDEMQHEFAASRVEVVAGGASRQASVMNALVASVDNGHDSELVAVHDAVRPFFRVATFHALVAAARRTGAALPATPVTDTIHAVQNGEIAATLDRRNLVAAQTPQVFRAQLLREVLERAEREGAEGTDEAGLAARFGFRVAVVPGDPANFKITRAEDLALAEAHFDEWWEAEA